MVAVDEFRHRAITAAVAVVAVVVVIIVAIVVAAAARTAAATVVVATRRRYRAATRRGRRRGRGFVFGLRWLLLLLLLVLGLFVLGGDQGEHRADLVRIWLSCVHRASDWLAGGDHETEERRGRVC